MSEIQAKIDLLEAEYARTQKNKATNYHLGTLKAKIAKLKSELINGPGGKSAGTKNAERGFDVSKSGDTRVGLVGFPSVGKSTLLTTLTGTRSEAAAYEFTTLTCIPGTMNYKGARIQVLDLPGIIEGAADGKGRGRQVISTARTCNMILIVLDAAKPLTHKKIIEQELFSFGIRINQKPPEVKVVKKVRIACNGVEFLMCIINLDRVRHSSDATFMNFALRNNIRTMVVLGIKRSSNKRRA
jgi:small GTP-binding protein